MLVGIQMIRMEDFEETAKAADRGEQKACDFILAFLHWNRYFENSDERPHCFSCGTVIHRVEDLSDDEPHEMGGFGFAKFSSDGAKETEGFGCPFCLKCRRKGPLKLSKQFAAVMEAQLGLKAVEVH